MSDKDEDNDNKTKSKVEANQRLTKPLEPKLSQFTKKYPEIWFAQAELQFEHYGCKSDTAKYIHVCKAIPESMYKDIGDILVNPPADDRYQTLKTALINRCSPSDEKRFEYLISKVDLGDNRPSEAYRTMKTMVGENLVSNQLLYQTWRLKLPEAMQIPLIAMEGIKTIDEIIELADRMFDASHSSGSLCSTSRQTTSSRSDKSTENLLETRIAKLEELMSKQSVSRSRSPTPSTSNNSNFSRRRYNRSRSRNGSRSRSDDAKKLCWYHWKWNDKAKHCIPPCDFQQNSEKPVSQNSKKAPN